MLTFIGLGLYDMTDISVKGLARIREADHILLETYTSRLMGSSRAELEAFYGREIIPLSREDVEVTPDRFLEWAGSGDVVFLIAGDVMVSTTHADLRCRAHDRGIPTTLIHGASIATAVCGCTGLQNYRFGKSCSVPFPTKNWAPTTPGEVIRENLCRDLHTLVYLDITGERFMTVSEGIVEIERMAEVSGFSIPLYIGIARAGSDSPFIAAGMAQELSAMDFGPPLHCLVVPASLHVVEREYLERFAGL
jgi:diphthine synthase